MDPPGSGCVASSAAREDQGLLQAQIELIQTKLNKAYLVDVSQLPKDVVVFGSKVKVRDLDMDEDEEFTLGNSLLVLRLRLLPCAFGKLVQILLSWVGFDLEPYDIEFNDRMLAFKETIHVRDCIPIVANLGQVRISHW